MKIEKNHVVRFHYTVSEPGQPALESSQGREPLAILVGHGNIIPGLEEALLGREVGENFEVTVSPEQAYGERRDGLTQRVPKKHFREKHLAKGMQVVLETNQGARAVTVQKVGMTVVDVDLNHPMAGKTLQFAIELIDARPGSEEEIQHGHAHGAGGAQH